MKNKADLLGEEIRSDLIKLSDEIGDNPELGNEEFLACKLHVELLEKYGFDVQKEYLGVKTGFRAEYDSKKPGLTVAFMAEYDALPEIGHGCGHNILGAASDGAGIILKNLIDEIGGKVVVLGTPAEETCGAKVTYAQNHCFDDIDFAMMSHPSTSHMKSGESLAIDQFHFEFRGKTSHAAAAPEKGINALDAVIATFNNINALRQQTRSDARIHGIIKEGGEAPNIIPDYCVAQFYVRAKTRTYLNELAQKVLNCAKAAALSTGAELTISSSEFSYDNIVTNQTLMNIYADNLLQYVDNIKEHHGGGGSTDTGNVSHVCPAIHPYFAISEDTSINGHSRELAASTKTDFAYDNMIITAKTMALTAIKVMENEECYKAIMEEFKNAEK